MALKYGRVSFNTEHAKKLTKSEFVNSNKHLGLKKSELEEVYDIIQGPKPKSKESKKETNEMKDLKDGDNL